MATVVESLFRSLGLDAAEVEKRLAQVEAVMRKSMQRMLRAVAEPVKSAVSFGRLFGQFTEGSDALGAFSARTGLAVKDVSAWSAAVEAAGGSAQAFRDDVAAMQEKLDEMSRRGSSGLSPLFRELGISVRGAGGEMKSVLDILPELAGKMEGMQPSGQRALLQELGFDDSAAALLRQGRGAVEESVEQQELFAATKEDAEAAREWNRSLSELQAGLQSIANVLFRNVVPWLTRAVDGATGVIRFLRQNEPFLLAFCGALAALFGVRLVTSLGALGSAIRKITILQYLWNTAIWLNPLTWIILLVAGLAFALYDLWKHLNGGKSKFEGLWKAAGLGPGTLKNLSRHCEDLKQAVGRCMDGMRKKWDGLVEAFRNSALYQTIEGLIKKLEELWGRLEDSGKQGARKLHEGELEPEVQAILEEAGVDVGRGAKAEDLDLTEAAAPVRKAIGVLNNFWEGFMNTLGGHQELNRVGPALAAPGYAPGGGDSRSSTVIQFNNTRISTQATDAQEFGREFPHAVEQNTRSLVQAVQTGTNQK